MLRFHLEKNADATLATHRSAGRRRPAGSASSSIDEDERVIGFQEKPRIPTPVPGSPDVALASMGIYIFKADVLVRALEDDASRPTASTTSGRTSSRR